jgi:hypothetical protein
VRVDVGSRSVHGPDPPGRREVEGILRNDASGGVSPVSSVSLAHAATRVMFITLARNEFPLRLVFVAIGADCNGDSNSVPLKQALTNDEGTPA